MSNYTITVQLEFTSKAPLTIDGIYALAEGTKERLNTQNFDIDRLGVECVNIDVEDVA